MMARKLNNIKITSTEISNTKYVQIYLTQKELRNQETSKEKIIKLKTTMEYFDEIIGAEFPSRNADIANNFRYR